MAQGRTSTISGDRTDSLIALGRRTNTLLRRWYQEVGDMTSCGELPQAHQNLAYACILGCATLGCNDASTPELRNAIQENFGMAGFRDAELELPRTSLQAGITEFDQLTWRACEYTLAGNSEALAQTLLPLLTHPAAHVQLHAIHLGWMSRHILCQCHHMEIVWSLLDITALRSIASDEALALAAQWFSFDREFLFYAMLHPMLVPFERCYNHILNTHWATGLGAERNRLMAMEGCCWELLACASEAEIHINGKDLG